MQLSFTMHLVESKADCGLGYKHHSSGPHVDGHITKMSCLW